MANQSAREMLSRLPVRMADGGSVASANQSVLDFINSNPNASLEAIATKINTTGADLGSLADSLGISRDIADQAYAESMATNNALLAAEERILGEIADDPSSWDVETAYNAILESGVSVQDALDAGVKQSTIDAVFTSPTARTNPTYITPSTVESSFTAFEPYSRMTQEEISANAKRYVAGLAADGVIDEAEKREVQRIATERGVTFQDFLAAGVSPELLFYSPKLKKKDDDKKDDDKEDDDKKDVKDISCPTGYRFDEATQSCVKIFAEVDTDTGSGADSATGVTVYQPIDFDPSVFAPGEESLDRAFRDSAPRTEVTEDIFGTQQLTGFDYTPAAKLLSATGSGFSWTPPTVTGRPRSLMSTDTLRRYTQGRAAQDLRQLVGGNEEAYRAFEPLLSQTGSYGGGLSRSQLFGLMQQQANQQAQQEAANYEQFGTRFGQAPVTGYAEIAQNIGSQNDPMTVRPIDLRYGRPFAEGGEVKKLEGSEELAAEGDTESAGMLANLLRGAKGIPSSIYGYGKDVFQSQSPSAKVLTDIFGIGGAIQEGAGEDSIGYALDMAPGTGEIRSAMDAKKYSDLADEARAAGDTEAAKMYEQLVTFSMAGAAPGLGMLARGAKRTVKAGAEAATQSSKMLDDLTRTTAQAPESPVRVPESGAPVKAQEFVNLENPKGSFKEVYNRIYPHQGDIKTPEEMVARAERIGPSFQDEIREVTNQLGLEKIETFGVKGLKSLQEKTRRGYELGTITDPIRTRILINTAEEAENAARMIADKMPTVDRGFQVIPGNGYFDRKLNVMYTGPNGERLLGEIQLVTPEMVRASEGQGHRLYEVERKLVERYGGGNVPQSHIKRFENMQEAQRQLYGGVADQADPKIIEELIPKFKKGGYVGKAGKS